MADDFRWIDSTNEPLLFDYRDSAYLELEDEDLKKIRPTILQNPVYTPEDALRSIVKYSYDNIMFAAKILLEIDLLPFQAVVIDQWLKKNFCIWVATRGAGKSFLLAVYSLLRGVLKQGSKTVVVSASFRQSMVVFNYMQDIYNQSPVLQEITGKSRPKKDISMCSFNIGTSKIICVPLGNGDKIRGLRADCVDGDTLISTDRGLVRIKDTQELMHDEDFRVFSGVGNNSFIPDYFMKTKPMDGYKIKTEYGFELICSKMHGVYTKSGMKHINDLDVGDKLEMNYDKKFNDKYIEVDGFTVDEKIGWLLGILVSEGCVSNEGTISVSNTDFDFLERTKLEKLGLKRARAREKYIPWSILQSPESVVVEFLKGLFEGDGSCFKYKSNQRKNNFGICYYTGSKKLANDLHVLMTKFNIVGNLGQRKSKISDDLQYYIRFYGLAAERTYDLLRIKKWTPIYNECCHDIRYIDNSKPFLKVKSIEKLEEKRCFYDYTIPEDHSFVGNSIKNRNCILCDEFAAIPESIFQIVVRGFSVVSLDPIGKVKQKFREKELEEAGVDTTDLKKGQDKGNQIVLTGTAYYQFNHFYNWYKKYIDIVQCGHDRNQLRKLLGDEATEEDIDQLSPEKFSVITTPYTALPYGFMDETVIAEGRATMTKSSFDMEFKAEFYKDSEGFFPRSLVDALSEYGQYGISVRGDKNKKYIMGVDPARQSDHFAIVIIEVDEEGKQHKVVYSWATNESKMKKAGDVNESQTYYGACSKKIRDLIRRFNVEIIMMDAGGGGREIANYLQEQRLLQPGELPIWDMDESSQRGYKGLHMLKLIDSNSNWAYEANHKLKKNLEQFQLLFPRYDTVAIADELEKNAEENQTTIDEIITGQRSTMIDTIEYVSEQTEEMKNEIANIVVTATPTGKEHFDLPKLTMPGQTKVKDKRRKDRYSACLLANWGIQFMISEEKESSYEVCGGTANSISAQGQTTETSLYRGLPHGVQRNAISAPQIIHRGGNGRVVY